MSSSNRKSKSKRSWVCDHFQVCHYVLVFSLAVLVLALIASLCGFHVSMLTRIGNQNNMQNPKDADGGVEETEHARTKKKCTLQGPENINHAVAQPTYARSDAKPEFETENFYDEHRVEELGSRVRELYSSPFDDLSFSQKISKFQDAKRLREWMIGNREDMIRKRTLEIEAFSEEIKTHRIRILELEKIVTESQRLSGSKFRKEDESEEENLERACLQISDAYREWPVEQNYEKKLPLEPRGADAENVMEDAVTEACKGMIGQDGFRNCVVVLNRCMDKLDQVNKEGERR